MKASPNIRSRIGGSHRKWHPLSRVGQKKRASGSKLLTPKNEGKWPAFAGHFFCCMREIRVRAKESRFWMARLFHVELNRSRSEIHSLGQQNDHPSQSSLEFIPNTAPTALLIQMAMFNQISEMLL
jgi:hypothetical protein